MSAPGSEGTAVVCKPGAARGPKWTPGSRLTDPTRRSGALGPWGGERRFEAPADPLVCRQCGGGS